MNAYYINMDDRIDRRKLMEEVLLHIDIHSERFNAITPKNIQISSKLVTPEVYCCMESHRGVYENISFRSGPFLILEDDIKIRNYKKFNKILRKINTQISHDNFDFLQIGYLDLGIIRAGYRRLRDLLWLSEMLFLAVFMRKIIGNKIRNYNNRVRVKRAIAAWELSKRFFPMWLIPEDVKAGAHCYVVTNKFANEAKTLNLPCFLSADQFLMSLSAMRIFPMYRLSSNLAKQNKSESSIGNKRFLLYSKS